MRALLLLALWSSPAGADPPRPDVTVAAPGPALATLEHQPTRSPTTATSQGGFSGIIITPPALADARPYPGGMVIAPPDTGDRMNAFIAPWALDPQALWQHVTRGLGTLWDALQPQAL